VSFSCRSLDKYNNKKLKYISQVIHFIVTTVQVPNYHNHSSLSTSIQISYIEKGPNIHSVSSTITKRQITISSRSVQQPKPQKMWGNLYGMEILFIPIPH